MTREDWRSATNICYLLLTEPPRKHVKKTEKLGMKLAVLVNNYMGDLISELANFSVC